MTKRCPILLEGPHCLLGVRSPFVSPSQHKTGCGPTLHLQPGILRAWPDWKEGAVGSLLFADLILLIAAKREASPCGVWITPLNGLLGALAGGSTRTFLQPCPDASLTPSQAAGLQARTPPPPPAWQPKESVSCRALHTEWFFSIGTGCRETHWETHWETLNL